MLMGGEDVKAGADLKLNLINLDFNTDLVEVGTIKAFNLKKGETVLFKTVYPEGIPRLKLKWEVDGVQDEFIFQYNGKNGNAKLKEYNY